MVKKSFTSSSVNIFKLSSILGIYSIMFVIRTKFYQIKFTTMVKYYDQLVEINHNRTGLIFLTILIES